MNPIKDVEIRVENRCFIRCGLRSKASMSVFLCGSLRRHTGGETTQNQHFLSSQKGCVGDGSFSHGKDQKLHGHVKGDADKILDTFANTNQI